MAAAGDQRNGPSSASESTTFEKDVDIFVNEDIGAASISPSGRDVVLASRNGLQIIDLDSPYSPPRHIVNRTSWDVADVQWSPFASRADWIASTCNQKALIYNLGMSVAASKAPIEHTLHAHTRAITDINFSAHHPDLLATCAVDSYVYTWDLRTKYKLAQPFAHLQPPSPVTSFADFNAGATQVKWNRKDDNIIASSHDRFLRIWDRRHGAKPVITIDAHLTKIYGIDWHRSDATKILTCSLDKTIKLWDLEKVKQKDNSKYVCRAIHTEYPVWRARHTPFPNGILAMPQRGSAALHLYTHAAGGPANIPVTTQPVHLFKAHNDEARVQEFLWRSRGTLDDGIDNREFQLVSWGSDQHLHLHKTSPELLANLVGFNKGDNIKEEPSMTRLGARYVTYHDDPPTTPSTSRQELSGDRPQPGGLSSLLQNASLAGRVSAQMFHDGHRSTMTAVRVGRESSRRVKSHIQWMDGVKVGERRVDANGKTYAAPILSPNQHPWAVRNDLAAEISNVGNRYSKVTFEDVDIGRRRVTLAFYGPWGEEETAEDRRGERKLVYLRFVIKFPPAYPGIVEVSSESGEVIQQSHPMEIEFEKTIAAIDEHTAKNLKEDMQTIADHYADMGRESLEAVICYGLGERDLEESLTISHRPGDSGMPNMEAVVEAESSSESDDDEGIDHEVMNSSLTNTNVPLAVQSSLRFSASGSLVVVRVKSANVLSAQNAPLRLTRLPRHGLTRNEIFESFGRFTGQGKHDHDSEDDSDSGIASQGSWESSSSPSSSSNSDNEVGAPLGRFQPPMAWQKATLRFQTKASVPSSASATKPIKSKSMVSILSSAVDEFIPSKRCLAEGYELFGDGPGVCAHNATVARKHGFEDLADIWELCKLILNNEVPLEILPQQHRREQVLVLARRAMVRIKRKDSGLDLQFDEADNVTNPKLRGRIKWGHHTVVTWLIPSLFEHFEREADTQMLAMLSCIFSEPAAREGVTSAMAKMRSSMLPMSMEAPAFSLDYFASADAAWSLFHPTISTSSTPAYSRYAIPVNEFGWHRLTKNLNSYGSHGSSNGPWGTDTPLPSEPVTPYSTGDTPPNLSRAGTLRSMPSHTPYSTSPEQQQTVKKSTSTNFASAFASLSRPFQNAYSSSPPVKGRGEGDLSTSAPTSGVTWGTTTFYSSGSNEQRNSGPSRTSKHGKRASFGQADHININYYSDTDSEYDDTSLTHDRTSEYTSPSTQRDETDQGMSIRVTLKNQDQFDDEASVSAPLLDGNKAWLYRAWREQYAEMLSCWGLITKRAEVLKFNGLIAYFPPGSGHTSKAGSVHLSLRPGDGITDSGPTTAPMSRTSTLAPPPGYPRPRGSQPASPRHFWLNPEAAEFRPGNTPPPFEPDMPLPPDVFLPSEQYLRLSIPEPVDKDRDVGEGNGLPGLSIDGAGGTKMSQAHANTHLRKPGFNRTTSNVSNVSNMTAASKDRRTEVVYSCSICWIRVSGRFYLCPGCGHVAHFECIPTPSSSSNPHSHSHSNANRHSASTEALWDLEIGECVVGCGCGCGLEDFEDVSEEDGMRAGWDERGGWMPVLEDPMSRRQSVAPGLLTPRPTVGYGGGFGEGVGAWRDGVGAAVETPGKGKGKRKGGG
ncbi:hypothetical protein BCR34DRAFT_596012 [Clohesyomyces aquaticus]|uniref:Uncharacterized protein n=1 Tax=Clohesyomyces aquaticus TaxID=1231657 RepID=A0A1Y2A8J5_9PLEO|nr:hypothetical protein BCR34DRAFT_596012 [Clohesyomyces aquaticus]